MHHLKNSLLLLAHAAKKVVKKAGQDPRSEATCISVYSVRVNVGALIEEYLGLPVQANECNEEQ